MFKQVIIVREDLDISRGKWGAQIAHASLSCGLKVLNKFKNWFSAWQAEGQKKIVLSVKNLDEMMQIKEKAKKTKIPYEVITDAGMTEIPKGTATCLAIGPAPDEIVDKITGSLPLFK